MSDLQGYVQTDDGAVEVHSMDELTAALARNSEWRARCAEAAKEAFAEYQRLSPLRKLLDEEADHS